jgi:outer membrane protein assembly factor BamB
MLTWLIETKWQRWTATAFVAGAVLVFGVLALGAHAAHRVSDQAKARQVGLKRAWFAQVRLDPSRNHVERAVLVGDRLSVLTTAGVLQELNALTGETLWIAPVGNPDYPSLGPAGTEQHVAVLNGSTLYILDRTDGRPVKIQSVGGAPGAAPALSAKHAFVPLVTGRIEAYPLEGQSLAPWYYQSFGRAMVAPLTTPDSFVWATDAGRLYVGRLPDLGVRYRLETGSDIVAPCAYRQPFIYVATLDGEVFALHEVTGVRQWKYATGFPVTRAPAAVGDRVFVTSEEPALHCIDASKGTSLWEAPNVAQFAALSATRVYGVDELGRMVALDAKTGALVARVAPHIETRALVNDQTDRIYLVSRDGMVQCLHELGADKPLYHRPPTTGEEQPAEPAATPPSEPAQPATATPPKPETEEASPFGEKTEETEMPEEEKPFGVDDNNPFDF